MVFLLFLGVTLILALSAQLGGNVGTYFNLDSLLIVVVGTTLAVLALSWGRWKTLAEGFRQVFFPTSKRKAAVGALFSALAWVVSGIGLLSSIQGCISGFLLNPGWPMEKIMAVASLTLLYSLQLSLTLFLPVALRNK